MIWFVGAGPGDPELLTIKGRRLLEAADLVVYTGSLVPPEVLGWVSPQAQICDSSRMYLEQVVSVMVEAYRAGRTVVRLHTGDPSLYGAVAEQMALLEEQGVPYGVVPGVSSFLAAAAALGVELTLPGVTQTVIITRLAGRTPVPEGESLSQLARHQATMVLFLSADRLAQVVEELLVWYPRDTPIAVVYKASQPDQKIIRGVLSDIVLRVSQEGVTKTAVIVVGKVLERRGERSRLYDPQFAHGFRDSTGGGRSSAAVPSKDEEA